jgi:hypothetical protein
LTSLVPPPGPKSSHAVLHRGQHEVGGLPRVVGGLSFASELIVSSGAVPSLRPDACPLSAKERQSDDADKDPAERHEDRDGVHRRAV